VNGPAWPPLSRLPYEPDQVLRLHEFRAARPDVIVEAGEFGTWQGRIPEPNGETVINRYTFSASCLTSWTPSPGQPEGR
jgi:hypothetical protein